MTGDARETMTVSPNQVLTDAISAAASGTFVVKPA